MRTFFLCGILLIIAVPTFAAQYTANSCSVSDVQSAVNLADDGDIVYVPPGSCTWSNQLSLPGSKGITLQGSGKDVTTINNGTGGYLISWGTSSSNSPGRITGFTFNGSSSVITISGNTENFRTYQGEFKAQRIHTRLFLASGVDKSRGPTRSEYDC